MSRVAKAPVVLPEGVTIESKDGEIIVKGVNGRLTFSKSPLIDYRVEDKQILFSWSDGNKETIALAGTARSIVNNMVIGVSVGFEKKLVLVGVGYRTNVENQKLNLALGYSHPIEFDIPDGITIETPSQTEISIKGCDKQLVGEVAAKIRSLRPPEPYKGKGIRYMEEIIIRKEAKKK